MTHAIDLRAQIDDAVAALQGATTSADARSHYETAATALASLAAVDQRARDNVASGERLVASDLVFGDALEAGRRVSDDSRRRAVPSRRAPTRGSRRCGAGAWA